MLRYYVCKVLPPEDPIFGTSIDPATGALEILVPAKPQRPALADKSVRVNWAADIPTDKFAGLALKDWCVAAVETDVAGHTAIDDGVDVIQIHPSNRNALLSFFSGRGVAVDVGDPQALLTALHPLTEDGRVPRVEDLRALP